MSFINKFLFFYTGATANNETDHLMNWLIDVHSRNDSNQPPNVADAVSVSCDGDDEGKSIYTN